MALSILGMTGIKLYLAVLVAVLVAGVGTYTVLDLGAEPYALSGDNEDSFEIDYIEAGQSTVAFTSIPSGATVIIDGKTYVTPTNDIELDPGSYDFETTLTDYESRIAIVSVEDGKAKTMNIVLTEVLITPDATPTPDGTATPTPDGTTVPDGTATPTAAPTDEAYEIPFGGVDVRVRAVTPFQGVELMGGYDEAEWLAVQGKRLLITGDNDLTLHQTSGYPNGVGNTPIDYTTSVSTSYLEFESVWTWGSEVDFTLTHTGSSSVGFIGSPVSGSFPAPTTNSALWEISVVPVTYGFAFDVIKQDNGQPLIKNNIVEPVGIAGGKWQMASLGSWNYLEEPVITVYAGDTEFGSKNYDLMNWMFWGPDVVNSDGDWIVGDASCKVVVEADDVTGYTTPGVKTMYVSLIDQHEIGTGDGTIPYTTHYEITYTLSVGDIVVTSVQKL